jgi:hypothetical protein
MQFPRRVQPACPGEGCAYGAWLACDSIPLYESPDEASSWRGYLAPDQTFEVSSGAVIVGAPTVVVVTRPTPQYSFLEDSRTFSPGDTLYVLDYLGEGFFNAWYADSILEVDVFWPWEAFFPADDYEYGGEVIQPGSSEFWVQTVGASSSEVWLRADAGGLAAPNVFDPEPPVCAPTGG